MCYIRNCTHCLYFEARKHSDLYLWAAKANVGPTIKFLVENISTMDEMRLLGNCLKGSRPVLSFDHSFSEQPHLSLARELFSQIFSVPKRHPKSKPFIDHMLSFSYLDGRIWVRHYQINDGPHEKPDELSLVEIGPRFCLQPILVLQGVFGGHVLWKNREYVSPNVLRAQERETEVIKAKQARAIKEGNYELKKKVLDEIVPTELDTVFMAPEKKKRKVQKGGKN